MRACLLALAGCWMAVSGAQAAECVTIPLADKVEQVMRAQASPTSVFIQSDTLGIGTLTRPRKPVCDQAELGDGQICTGTQSFTGRLFSAHGLFDVDATPIRSTFPETALTQSTPEDTLPWTDTPTLFAFAQPVSGPLHLDLTTPCTPHRIAPATEKLTEALTACYRHKSCPDEAENYLTSLRLAVRVNPS